MAKKDNYPTPRKGDKLKCLGCGGRGFVPDTKYPGNFAECKGCRGKGYISA